MVLSTSFFGSEEPKKNLKGRKQEEDDRELVFLRGFDHTWRWKDQEALVSGPLAASAFYPSPAPGQPLAHTERIVPSPCVPCALEYLKLDFRVTLS